MSVPPSSPAARRWGLAALGLAVAAVVAAGVTWRAWQRPTPVPPEVNLQGVDPEVAAALRQAREAVLRQPTSATAWGTLATRLHTYRFFPEALACYAEAERLEPDNADWPYLRAVILLDSPEPAAALAPLRRAVACDRRRPLPHNRLGEVLLEQGAADDAEAQFQAALALDPDEPRAHLRLAQVAAARGDWTGCRSHLEPASAAPSARKQVCALRLRACERLGDPPGAQAQQRLLAELPEDPPWPDAIVEQALPLQFGLASRGSLSAQLWREGKPQESLALLEDAVQQYPDSAQAWDRLGRTLGALGRFPEAERAFQRSLKLAPDQGDVWFFLGEIRREQRQFDGALAAFRASARLRPADAETRCKIGACLAALGDRDGAAAAYREALRQQPNLAEARTALARLGQEPRP
jgi:Tfp pilus assembly protein PilF